MFAPMQRATGRPNFDPGYGGFGDSPAMGRTGGFMPTPQPPPMTGGPDMGGGGGGVHSLFRKMREMKGMGGQQDQNFWNRIKAMRGGAMQGGGQPPSPGGFWGGIRNKIDGLRNPGGSAVGTAAPLAPPPTPPINPAFAMPPRPQAANYRPY